VPTQSVHKVEGRQRQLSARASTEPQGIFQGTEFKKNFNAGLGVHGSNARLTDIYTHHNGRYGLVVNPSCVGCPGPSGVVIEDSEIAFNNTRMLPTNGDAGGTKFTYSDGMIVRRNQVHDNYGSGLWWDAGNRNAQVYDNVINDNRNWGIFWEISYGGAKIHHNTLTGNGVSGGTGNFFNAVQLLVSASDGTVGGIEIYENTIDGAAYPLALINTAGHPTQTRNVNVHHNLMILRASTTKVGAAAFNGTTDLFGAAANNRFAYNTYQVPDLGGVHWAWNGQLLTWSQWRAFGHDVSGTLHLDA
jgi:Right handed beta helix region